MAKKARSRVADYLVYLAIRVAVALVQMLPYMQARRYFHLFARLAFHLDKRHREVARDNLRHAFPELAHDERKLDAMVQDCYTHFVQMFMEIVFLPRKMSLHTWRDHATLVNGNLILDRLTDGRPLLVVTGHFGNWEMAGYVLGLVGFRTYAIARTLDNPYLERFFLRFRQKTGQTILAKKGDFDRIQEILQINGTIATLGDQDAGQGGLFVDFFNRPASTHKAIALLALEYNAPLIVIGIPRVGEPMKYEIIAEDVIDPVDYQNDPNAVKNITIRYTKALERLIRRYPEQYFWLHRRWKHQPQVRARGKARAA
jgi:KDO2-lipid IV(A) lauroyltransferase